MIVYKIFETNTYIKKISKVDKRDKNFVQNKLEKRVYPQLKLEPHFGNNIKKLFNYNPETWRYRIGRYRIFYEIDNDKKIVNILYISLRKDAY